MNPGSSVFADPNFHVKLAARAKARTIDHWALVRRPNQIAPPGDWQIWLLMAGRGFGKTRVGAEEVRMGIQAGMRRLALIGATQADVRDTMVEGESGLIAVCERYGLKGRYLPSRRQVKFDNGARCYMYSADEPDRLRGPQHELAWGDEIGTWRYGEDAMSNILFGLRLGVKPRLILTSTPRVVPLVKDLMKRALSGDPDVVLTRGRTADNAANIPPATLRAWVKKYGGTRIGRQELEGELLEDVEGALWTLSMIDPHRLKEVPDGVELVRVVEGVDPSASSGESSAETGIIVAGLGSDGRGYILDDVSLQGSPHEWATATLGAYDNWDVDRIVPEVNNGGEMVTHTIYTLRPGASIKPVRATRGKMTRAEPVSALYEQGRISHVGTFPELEEQMTTWVPGLKSPDRMDALVWALTDLMLGDAGEFDEVPEEMIEDFAAYGLG